MTLLVRDLLISVLPPDTDGENIADRLPWWLAGCSGVHTTGYHLTIWFTGWPWAYPGGRFWETHGISPHQDPASMALLLRTMKKQLETALKELDNEAHEPGKRGPQGASEVRDLEIDLRKALQEVKREEHAIDERLRPHTLKEVEELEARLDEAQAELKRLKSELEKT